MKIIVDLLYNSEVTVPKNLELKVKKALNDLKITGTETVDLNIENFKKPMKGEINFELQKLCIFLMYNICLQLQQVNRKMSLVQKENLSCNPIKTK